MRSHAPNCTPLVDNDEDAPPPLGNDHIHCTPPIEGRDFTVAFPVPNLTGTVTARGCCWTSKDGITKGLFQTQSTHPLVGSFLLIKGIPPHGFSTAFPATDGFAPSETHCGAIDRTDYRITVDCMDRHGHNWTHMKELNSTSKLLMNPQNGQLPQIFPLHSMDRETADAGVSLVATNRPHPCLRGQLQRRSNHQKQSGKAHCANKGWSDGTIISPTKITKSHSACWSNQCNVVGSPMNDQPRGFETVNAAKEHLQQISVTDAAR